MKKLFGLGCACLGFAFFFFPEVGCPLELTRVTFEAERAFLAFTCVKPQNSAVVLNEHHSSARWKFGTAE